MAVTLRLTGNESLQLSCCRCSLNSAQRNVRQLLDLFGRNNIINSPIRPYEFVLV